MDPLTYFLSNSLFLFALLGLLTFILGLILGYLIWAKSAQSKLAIAYADLDECRHRGQDLQRSFKRSEAARIAAEKEVTRLTEAAKKPAEKIFITEKQKTFYHPFIEQGKIRYDEVFGYLYTQRPAEVDDLVIIKGVGEALNAKLNDHGIYTFRQIATWDEAKAEHFAERLDAFKDRIVREDWIGQSRQLHFEKYGEWL